MKVSSRPSIARCVMSRNSKEPGMWSASPVTEGRMTEKRLPKRYLLIFEMPTHDVLGEENHGEKNES